MGKFILSTSVFWKWYLWKMEKCTFFSLTLSLSSFTEISKGFLFLQGRHISWVVNFSLFPCHILFPLRFLSLHYPYMELALLKTFHNKLDHFVFNAGLIKFPHQWTYSQYIARNLNIVEKRVGRYMSYIFEFLPLV